MRMCAKVDSSVLLTADLTIVYTSSSAVANRPRDASCLLLSRRWR